MVGPSSSGGAADAEAARKPTYAQLVASTRSLQRISIGGVKPPAFTDKGEPAVFFTKEEFQRSLKPFEYAIIAKCSYGRPPIPEVKTCLMQWLSISRDFILSNMNPKHLLIRFDDEEDFIKLFLRNNLYVKGFLFRWTPDFHFNEDPTAMRLSGLVSRGSR